MSLNCMELELALKSFPQMGIVKGFAQSDKNSIYITIFDGTVNHTIYISTRDGHNRVSLLPTGVKPTTERGRFAQFLNAEHSGSRLNAIYQFHYSRIIVIELAKKSAIERLVIRLWGQGGNILLLDSNDTIIDCLKRFPKKDEWPEEPFTFPEPKTLESVRERFTVRAEFTGTDINDRVYFYYKELEERAEFEKVQSKLQTMLNKELSSLSGSLNKINDNLNDEKEYTYRLYGELLTANIYRLKRGMDLVTLTDYNDNKEVKIELKPDLSPADNANRYFTKYKKMKEGKERWEQQKSLVVDKLEYVERLCEQVDNTGSLEGLDPLYSEIKGISGYYKRLSKSKAPVKGKKRYGREFRLSDEYRAFVSKNSKDADEILKRVACGNDYWFHIRDYAGSHVVVKKRGREELSERARLEAAMLALHFSKAKNADEGDIYFTRVKYLHKPNNNTPGLVFPTQEKNIKIKIDKDILGNILNRIENI